MNPPPATPAELAGRRLFEPLADLLTRLESARLPDPATLDAILREIAPGTVTASGQPVRFDACTNPAHGYEAHIHDTGVVPTRDNDWHDFFNALSWCVWPRTKAALNAAHVAEIAARAEHGLAGRGARRDALTQFDECGLLVVSCDPDVLRLLSGHAWEAVFVTRRATLARTTRFLIVGHGTWDQLRSPFRGLCAKAVHREVSPQWMDLPAATQQADADGWLAERILAKGFLDQPLALRPLPILGIPGVTADSESPDYYRDTGHFRARRVAA